MNLKIRDHRKILASLFINYIQNSYESLETSSHWRKFGAMTSVKSIGQEYYDLSGIGFGDYTSRSITNYLKNIPSNIYIRSLTKLLPLKLKEDLYESCKKSKRLVTFDCVKHALAVNKLILNNIDLNNKKICIIGDGYGFLGIFLKQCFPSSKIISVNLGKVLFFDAACTLLAHPKSEIVINASEEMKTDTSNDFNFIPAEILKFSEIDDVEIFFNIASMQEMNLSTIKKYMGWIGMQNKKSVLFYCCNRENKYLPDGSLIQFNDYGWNTKDSIIFDEQCNWYDKYPINTPPFIKKFDGVIRHRLVRISDRRNELKI